MGGWVRQRVMEGEGGISCWGRSSPSLTPGLAEDIKLSLVVVKAFNPLISTLLKLLLEERANVASIVT
jgi:hypothetical protein